MTEAAAASVIAATYRVWQQTAEVEMFLPRKLSNKQDQHAYDLGIEDLMVYMADAQKGAPTFDVRTQLAGMLTAALLTAGHDTEDAVRVGVAAAGKLLKALSEGGVK